MNALLKDYLDYYSFIFGKYCPICKFSKVKDYDEEPCKKCLNCYTNQGPQIPIYFEENN